MDFIIELMLGIGLVALFSKRIIKTIKNMIVLGGVIVISVVMRFTYKLPYLTSLAVCIVLNYGVIEFIIAGKNLVQSLIKSKNRYEHGFHQKIVNILINCNYSLFLLLCYCFSINELINPSLTLSKIEGISISIIIIIGTKILRKIIERFFRNNGNI